MKQPSQRRCGTGLAVAALLGVCFHPGIGFAGEGASSPSVPFQSFPALAVDGSGTPYLAVVEREGPKSRIAVFEVSADEPQRIADLDTRTGGGVARPTLAGRREGVLVAFPATGDDGRWRLRYAFVADGEVGPIHTIDDGGSPTHPASACGQDRCIVVWESNRHGDRTIEAAWIAEDDTAPAPEAIETLSSRDANSRNPDVVISTEGRAFAAWDSFREGRWDLFGASFADGTWSAERHLTQDPRIERHVDLESVDGEVWMAWEANEFDLNHPLGFVDSRVRAAKLGDGGLFGPVTPFRAADGIAPHRAPRTATQKATAERSLIRPRLAFDRQGRLWMTARQSLGTHAGWAVIARAYTGGQWSEAYVVSERQGRWAGAPLVFDDGGPLVAVQTDDQPASFRDDLRTFTDPHSQVTLRRFAAAPGSAERVTRPLETATTSFRSAERVERSDADLPRQKRTWKGKTLKLFWGNLHAHSALSVCNRDANPPPEDLLAIERDLDRLDFCALTDHGFSLDHPAWAYTRDVSSEYDDPGRFLTLLGEEWSSGSVPPKEGVEPRMTRHGHYNILFKDRWSPKFFDSTRPTEESPPQIAEYMSDHEFVMIPHGLADWTMRGIGNPPTDWSVFDEVHVPLAEIYQRRGSYECRGCPRQAATACPFDGHYLRDAWSQGIVVGTIAAPDHGGGDGYAGVWAEDLTAEALFEAFHARHTLGTTGEKTALFFSSTDGMMGDKIQRTGDGPIPFEVWARSATPIEMIEIFRNGEPVFTSKPNQEEVTIEWTDPEPPSRDSLWYYVRIRAAPGTRGEGGEPRLAWSSPIWFYREVPPPRRFAE